MIEIHLYGRLRLTVDKARPGTTDVLRVEPGPDETVKSLLSRIGVPLEEVHHVFLNGRLLVTRNRMAPWLQYPQAQDDVWDWDAEHVVRPDDRLGLFGEDMAALVV
jgi:hypothetical protein